MPRTSRRRRSPAPSSGRSRARCSRTFLSGSTSFTGRARPWPRARSRSPSSAAGSPSSTREPLVVRRPLGAVIAVEAELAAAELADGEEVALVALVVVGAELDVAGRAAVGGRHPADALEAVAHLFGRRHRGVGDAADGGASRVVGQGDDDIA